MAYEASIRLDTGLATPGKLFPFLVRLLHYNQRYQTKYTESNAVRITAFPLLLEIECEEAIEADDISSLIASSRTEIDGIRTSVLLEEQKLMHRIINTSLRTEADDISLSIVSSGTETVGRKYVSCGKMLEVFPRA